MQGGLSLPDKILEQTLHQQDGYKVTMLYIEEMPDEDGFSNQGPILTHQERAKGTPTFCSCEPNSPIVQICWGRLTTNREFTPSHSWDQN